MLDPNRSDASQFKPLLKPPGSPSRLRHEHYATGAEQQQKQSLSATARTAVEDSDANTQTARTPQSRVVLYRGAYMQPFRLLVRFKIFQLVGIASLAIPINTFLVEVCHSSSVLIDPRLRNIAYSVACFDSITCC